MQIVQLHLEKQNFPRDMEYITDKAITQCFDSLWLKLVLWEAGVNNELFTLIYALNMKSNITVLTSYGPTEEFSVKYYRHGLTKMMLFQINR